MGNAAQPQGVALGWYVMPLRGCHSAPGGAPLDMGQAVAANGYGLFERRDDWSSCAWFYLDRPVNDLPPLAPVAERTVGLLGSEDATQRADA